MAKKGKVFVTRELPEAGMEMLREYCETVEANTEDRPLTKPEIIAGVKDKDALVCLLSETIDKEIISAAPGLKIIADYAAGYNNIDVAFATERGICVTNTPDALTHATADITWALLLAAARRLIEGDKMMRAGKFEGWAPKLMRGSAVFGRTIGIVGLGRIGSEVARRAKGFGMKVLYISPSRKEKFEKEFGAVKVGLEDMLKQADYICLHCPLTPDTKHLIGAKQFAMMKKTAYLINMARGPVVDEKALVTALRERRIAGAALDVYEREPKMEEGLADLDNVVLAPHLGSATTEARNEMAFMVARNIAAALSGEVPPNCVNPDYKKNR